MTLALLGMLVAISVTGVMMTTDAFWGAQWVEDLHEGLVYVTLGLIALHVAGVLLASYEHGENLGEGDDHGAEAGHERSGCGGRDRKAELDAEAAERRAPERQRAAVGLDHLGHDGKTQPRAGLGLIEAPAPGEHGPDAVLRNARPVVLDREHDRRRRRADR